MSSLRAGAGLTLFFDMENTCLLPSWCSGAGSASQTAAPVWAVPPGGRKQRASFLLTAVTHGTETSRLFSNKRRVLLSFCCRVHSLRRGLLMTLGETDTLRELSTRRWREAHLEFCGRAFSRVFFLHVVGTQRLFNKYK